MDPRPQDSSGRRSFCVVRTLGEGAFGSVYLADMTSAGGFRRRVALKLLNGSWDPESDAGRRLRDEARLLGRLQHRHIVRVDDLLQLGGRWALLMEYIPGLDAETLFARACERKIELPVRVVLQICAATASALEAAYTAAGDDGQALCVVHRDIKPSNVRLSETGEVKVLDFGVARADFAGRESKTERVRYGSLGYMAPERLLGEPETAAGDVYSLGVMLSELLTLETLGRVELAPAKQLEQVAGAVSSVRVRAGDAVAEALRAMLSYDPGDRPSVRQIESTLRRAAAALDGPDVHEFAADSFGGLAQIVADGEDASTGTVLDESTLGLLLPALSAGGGRASPTLALKDLSPVEEAPTLAQRAPLILGVVFGLLVGLGGLAGLMWQWDPAVGDAVVSPSVSDPKRVAVAPAVAVPLVAVEASPVAPVQDADLAPREGEARVASTEPLPSLVPRLEAPAAPAPAAPGLTRLRSAKVVLMGGEGLSVTCGDVTATGSTNVLLREFPSGDCVISSGGHRVTVDVQAPRQVNCTLAGDVLSCR